MGEGRLAKKGLLDPLKLSGGSPGQPWGLKQWFSSSPRRTLPVDDMDEVSKNEKPPLAAVDMTARGKGTVTGYWWQHLCLYSPEGPGG